MNEKLNDALNEISDKHIAEAAKPRKHRPYWIAAVAAVLAVAILAGMLWQRPVLQGSDHSNTPEPGTIQSPSTLKLSNLVASAEYPKMLSRPDYADYDSYEDYNADYAVWRYDQKTQYDQPDGYADNLTSFFADSIREFLSGEENQAYSPVNVYLALAMLAETTDGNSRQQILDLLGAGSIEELREQAGYVWNAHYCNDGETTLLLGNSLWLDSQYSFQKDTVDLLADSYYASVFSGDLGSSKLNQQLQTWLNAHTGGLLEEQAGEVELEPETVFALASTVYFSAGWVDEFNTAATKEQVFHCAEYDLMTPFMNQSYIGAYYQGKNFSAVYLNMTGSNAMWLILPNKGRTVADVLKNDEYLQLIRDPGSWEDRKYASINLSLPKFDISSKTNLIGGIKNLGITDIFDPLVSDFTAITQTPLLYVSKIDHAARVAIDEEGCIAAAFTVIAEDGVRIPTETIDFVLDRPFLFVISSRDNLPLFAGTVTEP